MDPRSKFVNGYGPPPVQIRLWIRAPLHAFGPPNKTELNIILNVLVEIENNFRSSKY